MRDWGGKKRDVRNEVYGKKKEMDERGETKERSLKLLLMRQKGGT